MDRVGLSADNVPNISISIYCNIVKNILQITYIAGYPANNLFNQKRYIVNADCGD